MPKSPDLRSGNAPSGSKSNSVTSGMASKTKAWNSKNQQKVHETGSPPRGKVGGLPHR